MLIAVLALAPLDKKGDVSFILDKKKVESAPERMRVEAAQYTGTDDKGQQFVMTANRAIQRSSDNPLVDISGMFARLNQAQGPVLIAANQGRYNHRYPAGRDRRPGEGRRRPTASGSTPATSTVDLKQRQLASQGPAQGGMRLGQFRANRIRADLGEHKVVLDGGARLKIVQGAVR